MGVGSRNPNAPSMTQRRPLSPPAPTTLSILIACFFAPLAAKAQEGGSSLLEGHSSHGEVFNEGPRQAAYLMDKPDSVHFPVTVASEPLQQLFDQGVGQLHGFWYFEAERSFRQIAAEDPDCAMAFWGMAMANVDHPERARGFARVAWLKRGLVSEREGAYIDAIARFHEVEGPEEPAALLDEESDQPPVVEGITLLTQAEKKARELREREQRASLKRRAQRLVKDYEQIIWDDPTDIEARAFLANRLWLNRRAGLSIPSRFANEALLQQIFEVEPMHPAHHYRIHLWDAEDAAERVIDSAVKCGPSWPGIAHMWHMGGHIFARLGRHADAAWQQEASARVDHAHLLRDRVLPDRIHNFAHNNEWLTRSLRHSGRVQDAVELAKNMIELPRHPLYNTLSKRGCSASWGRIRLLETLSLFEQWSTIVELAQTMYLESTEEATDGALRASTLGTAALHLDDSALFEAQVRELESMLEGAKLERAAALDSVEEEALAHDFEKDDLRAALDDVLDAHAGTLADLREKLDNLHSLHRLLSGEEIAESLQSLDDAGFEPAQLATLYLRAGVEQDDPVLRERALELAREVIDDRDGRLHAHATLAHVLWETGHDQEALEVFDQLRPWTARADLELPVFERLSPLARARGLKSDWRVEEVQAADVGTRVDLATLGPLHWSPPEALPWTCADAFGGQRSLDDYRGGPVIVIFFLGFGCVHCVEQLQAFIPAQPEFEQAGIDIVAIGTDSAEKLAHSFGEDPDDTGYPFPVLADPELEAFRLYRAYDDFEQMPLHGTFLVDARGRTRWEDVSYEPFMDWEFLLQESQRLLGLEGRGRETPAQVESSSAAPTQTPSSSR